MGAFIQRFVKIGYVLREAGYLIREHKYYFLAPILLILAVLAFLVYYIGPSIVVSFIYAGV